jgi:outer membrane protein assembly factor BamB
VWSLVHKADGTVSDLAGDGAWDQPMQSNGYGRPSIPLKVTDLDALYVGSTDGSLYELALADGTVSTWIVLGDGGATVGSPGLDNQNSLAYVGSEDGSVYAVGLPLTP